MFFNNHENAKFVVVVVFFVMLLLCERVASGSLVQCHEWWVFSTGISYMYVDFVDGRTQAETGREKQ